MFEIWCLDFAMFDDRFMVYQSFGGSVDLIFSFLSLESVLFSLEPVKDSINRLQAPN
jgi:hypothetical protein